MELPNGSIIVSGPIIIENNKVLLDREKKEGKITPWFFPGGLVENFDESLRETCKREVKEELGVEIEIIKPLETVLTRKNDKIIILIHYLAKRTNQEISKGNIVEDWAWHDIHNLPEDCAPNVKYIIQQYIEKEI